jgi:hypothetical protein
MIRAIASGIVRFVVAMVVGLVLLFIAACMLAIVGDPWRIQGIVIVGGAWVMTALALRYAIAGQATRFERGVAAVTALFGTAGLAGAAVLAGFVLLGALALEGLFLLGGAPGTAAAITSPIIAMSQIGISIALFGGLGLMFLAWRVWKP